MLVPKRLQGRKRELGPPAGWTQGNAKLELELQLELELELESGPSMSGLI